MAGKFVTEIIPVGDITQDDGIRPSTTLEGLSKLPPVFDKETGMTTAGNSSQLTDGAAAILLMSRREARKRKLRILGVWRGFSVLGVPPKLMGIGPRYAIPRLLQGLHTSSDKIDLSRIDVFEINEAFASQASWCIKELHIDPQKVNPNGGAIALGHPLGCTGARLVVTLLHELNRSHKHLGIVSMCIGTGMGAAALLEVEHSTANLKQGDYTKSIRSSL
jgi:acetyl-CoA acyltransferase 1